MSFSFFLPHKKKFFSSSPCMTVKEIMEIIPKLREFSVDMREPSFDKVKFYESPLNTHSSLVLGHFSSSSRGFNISYEKLDDGKNYYRIRILTPSSIDDWKLALTYTKALANKLGVTTIIGENGEEYTPETLEQFDYKQDILYGIKAMFPENIDNKTSDSFSQYIMYGIFRKVIFTKNFLQKILNADDPVEEFSTCFFHTQNPEVYQAKQTFYQNKNDNSIFGVYTLTQGVDTFLPYEPFVEPEHSETIKPNQVNSWNLSLVGFKGEEEDNLDNYFNLGMVDYRAFIRQLPKDKWKFVDGVYILVKGLTREEINETLAKI